MPKQGEPGAGKRESLGEKVATEFLENFNVTSNATTHAALHAALAALVDRLSASAPGIREAAEECAAWLNSDDAEEVVAAPLFRATEILADNFERILLSRLGASGKAGGIMREAGNDPGPS